MRKYLKDVRERFVGLKAGIKSNASIWVGQVDTPATVQEEIDLLDAMDAEIELLNDQLSQKIATARSYARQKKEEAKVIEKRAIGLHATTPGKLVEYNIRIPRAAVETRELPQKAIIRSVKEHEDGVGFKITIKGQGLTVDYWEIERGKIDLAAKFSDTATGSESDAPVTNSGVTTVLQPPYPFLKSTKKLRYVDNDVVAGVRYFYRVRGVNATGEGAWSEPVSAVR